MENGKNIANVEELIDHSECEECNESFLFLMKDNYHSFYLPLDVVFNCLQIASIGGCIPTLPQNWLREMKTAGYTIIKMN